MSTAYIVACTASKRRGLHAAGLKYNGPHMVALLDYMWAEGWASGDEAAILSAGHGLLHLREPVGDYDQYLTDERAFALYADPRQHRRMRALVRGRDRVVVAGGRAYRVLARRLLRAAGYRGEVVELGGQHVVAALEEMMQELHVGA